MKTKPILIKLHRWLGLQQDVLSIITLLIGCLTGVEG